MGVFSVRLKELRLEHEWSQETVARKLDLTLRTYCRYEVEGSEPKMSVLVNMADLYGVSIDYLAGRTERREFETGKEGAESQARDVGRGGSQ